MEVESPDARSSRRTARYAIHLSQTSEVVNTHTIIITQEDCESTESVPQRKTTQSLACIMADFFRRLKPIAIGMLEERGTAFLSHHNSSRGDEAHTLNHDKTNLFVGAGDGAEGKNLQETRMSRPTNAGQDGGQTTPLPTNGSTPSSSSQTLRVQQSDDDHPDGRCNKYQSNQSSEGEFDDQTAGEAAPTRPRKRRRRSTSRGPPHSLLPPPASQPQTQPNTQTHALNGTFHPQFGQSSSAGRALHQSVPPNNKPGFQDTVDAPQGKRAPEGSSDAATPSEQDSNLTELSVNAGTNSSFLSLVMNDMPVARTKGSARGMGIPPSFSSPPMLQPQSWPSNQMHTLN